jgi:hypothetical protein
MDDAFWAWLQSPSGKRGVIVVTGVLLVALAVAKVIGGAAPATAVVSAAVAGIVILYVLRKSSGTDE